MIKSNITSLIVGLAIYSLPFALNAELVNINSASAAALSHHLKGIGAKKAKLIVSYRQANGDFVLVSDITNVKGIGEGLLKKNLKDMSLTEGVTKLVKVNAEDKLVVIESKKTTQPKSKLKAVKKVAINVGQKKEYEAAKKKKVGVKLPTTKKVVEKKTSSK